MTTSPRKQKLYCYVDETGQDTGGELFLVSVVITAAERDALRKFLEEAERDSEKGERKWIKAKPARRNAYIRSVLKEPAFKGKLHYAVYRETTDYLNLTIETTADAIAQHAPRTHKATVVVDGLRKSEQRLFATRLRRRGIRTEKVRGATEQADIFIRLADALCGFLREALTVGEIRRLRDEAIREGYIVPVDGK